MMNKYEDVDIKYAHVIQVIIDWVDTTILAIVAGRGLAKSTVIQARRSCRCIYDMPGGAFAFIANTYVNLHDNIMPAVQKGWQLMGLIEGVHYIKGKRPPQSWRSKCSVIIDKYEHVYSFWNGCVVFLGSLDNPSLLAGKSVIHLFYDEAKYAKDVKVNRAMPILRGDAIAYGHSHLFLGITITTDMPDVNEGEFDWFFRYVNEMDPERILRIAQVAAVHNKLLLKFVKQKKISNVDAINKIAKKIAYYDNALLKLRKNQTFFLNASSLANVDILTSAYISRLYNGTLELHEFKKSVIGMRPGLNRSIRFYVAFSETHKYFDGTLSGEGAYTSRELRYLRHDKPIDGGMDFGNMLSLVIGQTDGQYYRLHKNLYEIPPGWFRELADQFLEFFINHECKLLELYYDRAGNNFEKQKEDYASKIKDAIEKRGDGTRSGWVVNLNSRKQAIIRQEEEYDFMQELMTGANPSLPLLRIDAVNCKEAVSSIELAPAMVKYKGNVKAVLKVKKSEKMKPEKLPMYSTNFSDAFKYLIMTKQRRSVVRGKASSGADPFVAGFD